MISLNAQTLVQRRNTILQAQFKSEYEELENEVTAHFSDDLNLLHDIPFEGSTSLKAVCTRFVADLKANGFNVTERFEDPRFFIRATLPTDDVEVVLAHPEEKLVLDTPPVSHEPTVSVSTPPPSTSPTVDMTFHGAPY